MLSWKKLFLKSLGTLQGNDRANILSCIEIRNDRFYQRVLNEGSLGLGESYMNNDWDTNIRLDTLFFQFRRKQLEKQFTFSYSFYLQLFMKKILAWAYNFQNPIKSLEVAEQHYNLSNEMYEQMLDNYMMYSCGYWKNATNLNEAQEHKLDLICKKIGLHNEHKDMKVLDIGCGWGGFVEYASKTYGANVTGITNSEEQWKWASQRKYGSFALMDYRDLLSDVYTNQFDCVVSVGMFEHVGPKNYLTFLKVCQHVIKPSGIVLLHTIGGLKAKSIGDPWFNKYIFPNSVLPTLGQISTAVEQTSFVIEDVHNFGADYDKTLLVWYKNFEEFWYKNLEEQSTSTEYTEGKEENKFFRMWKYYLLQSAGLFRARDLQLYQIVLSKGGILGGYESVR